MNRDLKTPRLVYLARRHPRFSHQEFIHRWRQHGALGMSQARWHNVIHYSHCDRIDGLDAGIPTLDCDGIAQVVYRSELARRNHRQDAQASATMKADERETFAMPVSQASLMAHKRACLRNMPGRYALFAFWTMTNPDGEAAWLAHGKQCVATLSDNPDIRAYLQNDLTAHIDNTHFAYQGLEQITADDTDTLASLARTWTHHSRVPGTARFVLTRVVTLHDEAA